MSDACRICVDIAAPPERVFDHFIEPTLLVRWMGDFAQLDASDGGLFRVDINGVLIRGHYVRVDRPRLIEIAWGEAGNADMPPGATRLRIELIDYDGGTRLHLTHSGLVTSEAGKHAIGWPHFLARLVTLAGGADPGPDPWAAPTAAQGQPSVENTRRRTSRVHTVTIEFPMPKFALLLHESPYAYKDMSPDEIQAIIQRYVDWMNTLKQDGRYVSGEKLCPESLVVRRHGDDIAIDGPYMESKEVLGGLMIIEAASYAEAAALTRQSPHFDRGWIEIRRVDLA